MKITGGTKSFKEATSANGRQLHLHLHTFRATMPVTGDRYTRRKWSAVDASTREDLAEAQTLRTLALIVDSIEWPAL
jgi:hypothetical protein